MIKITNLTKKYHNKYALNDISLIFPENGVFGVIGPNGSGKTSLFKAITGVIINDEGSVIIENTNNDYLPQNYISFFANNIFYDTSIIEMIEIIYYIYNDFNKNKMIDICNDFELNLNDKIKNLSIGQKACLNFAFTVSRNVLYYILDEPFDGIDVIVKERIIQNILKYLDIENKLLIISSHELNDLERIIDHFIILNNGVIIEENSFVNLSNDNNIKLTDYMINRLEENENENK